MKMRLAVLPLLMATAVFAQAPAASQPAELSWTEDYAAAVAQAKKEHKLLLLNFTGSDWCIPCQALDHTVFASADFRKWAADRLVLVTLDYPARKKQDDALKARNKELKEQYKIEGYPTVLIVDPNTEKEGARSLGFPDEETAAGWISKMRAQLDKVKLG
jgi:thiol:disulfide interchange protein